MRQKTIRKEMCCVFLQMKLSEKKLEETSATQMKENAEKRWLSKIVSSIRWKKWNSAINLDGQGDRKPVYSKSHHINHNQVICPRFADEKQTRCLDEASNYSIGKEEQHARKFFYDQLHLLSGGKGEEKTWKWKLLPLNWVFDINLFDRLTSDRCCLFQ